MDTIRNLFSAPQPVVLLPHDGVCNTMPGWMPTWKVPNVHADPDCKNFPFYAHRGLGMGASYGQANFAIAPQEHTAAHAMAHTAM